MGETEYKRTAMVPTVDGTTITVKCGDPSWPNMNGDNEPAQVYTVNVKVKSGDKLLLPPIPRCWFGRRTAAHGCTSPW